MKKYVALLTVGMAFAFSANAALASAGQCGGASWYALTSKTASGERMNPAGMTAAHRTLPLGTKVKVTNQANGKSLIVRINDRGPFIKGRVLDLSKGAASRMGFINAGHTKVCITPVAAKKG
ncbi:septal ring lytic transglycosylase RlpA family protein [Paenochrobactrum sp. BZR 588]|uniref:septal ring lytic transglycosylase RlpA family protein n=1 Tax=unclassified Paenochrobactrum TaxID=2639760 RepID=UPI003853ACDB